MVGIPAGSGNKYLEVRPIGLFWMHDEKGPDAKLLCVLADDPRWEETENIDDLPKHLLDEISAPPHPEVLAHSGSSSRRVTKRPWTEQLAQRSAHRLPVPGHWA